MLLAAASLLGCDALSKPKVDNPVMGPPPPRLSQTEPTWTPTDLTPRSYSDQDGEISLASLSPRETASDGEFSGSQVVATVNGAPIFDSEILAPYSTQLLEAQQKTTPAEFQQLRQSLIKRDLPAHVDRELLVQALRSTLKKEQIDMLDQQLDLFFQREIERLKQEMGVTTRHEVEAELRKQGTSLDGLKQVFSNQMMAREYLRARAEDVPKIGRPELIRYYEEHLDDYHVPDQVKWQQILLQFDEHGGRKQTLQVLEEIIDKLREGTDFGELAREYSDGPTASQSGLWDWTRRGSLADERIEKALFELPEGMISQVFVGEDDYQLIRVVQRRPERTIPFEEVQDEIKKELVKQAREKATAEVLENLRANAVVWTAFD